MKIQDFIQLKRTEILNLVDKYGAYDVRVFGSVARGDDNENSDIDFLVKMKQGSSLFDLGGLLFDLQKLIGRKVDVISENGLRPRIKDKILSEAVNL